MSKQTKMTRKEFAELGNNLLQCGNVTFNADGDDKEDFRKFKFFCGKVSNLLTRYCADWNTEAESRFRMSDEVIETLHEYEAEMEATTEIGNKKKRVAERKKIKEKYQVTLALEEKCIENLNAYFDEEEEVELQSFPISKMPLNINGGYMDKILPVLDEGRAGKVERFFNDTSMTKDGKFDLSFKVTSSSQSYEWFIDWCLKNNTAPISVNAWGAEMNRLNEV